MGLAKSACEAEVASRRTCKTRCLWEIDLNPKSTTHDPEFFNTGASRSINPAEAVDLVLQCRAQSTQASSSQCRTTAIGRGSLLKSVETAGGVATSSPSIAPPSPPRREFCAEASPTDRDGGQDCLRLLFHYARHSEREYLKDNSKLATK